MRILLLIVIVAAGVALAPFLGGIIETLVILSALSAGAFGIAWVAGWLMEHHPDKAMLQRRLYRDLVRQGIAPDVARELARNQYPIRSKSPAAQS